MRKIGFTGTHVFIVLAVCAVIATAFGLVERSLQDPLHQINANNDALQAKL